MNRPRSSSSHICGRIRATSPRSIRHKVWAALQVLTDLVSSGSASKAVLTWSQPDVAHTIRRGACSHDGERPWELPVLDQQYHLKYGVDYGVVPMPVPQAGAKPSVPLGGEAWVVPVSSNTTAVKATVDLLKWLESPTQLVKFDKAFGYIPALKAPGKRYCRFRNSRSSLTSSTERRHVPRS